MTPGDSLLERSERFVTGHLLSSLPGTVSACRIVGLSQRNRRHDLRGRPCVHWTHEEWLLRTTSHGGCLGRSTQIRGLGAQVRDCRESVMALPAGLLLR